jgi:probable phosphoglycerate mutase
VELNANGRAQGRALAAALANEAFDRVLTSDLVRASETARAIVGGRIPIEPDARWREFAFGSWEGLTWAQILEREPNLAESGIADPSHYVPEGGERFDEVCARVSASLAEIRDGAHAGVLVVTHAGPIHAALRALFGEHGPALKVRLSPASITRVRLTGDGAQLVALNDVSHLA